MQIITDIAARAAQNGNQIITSEVAVTGGTLYITSVLNSGVAVSVAQSFVPLGTDAPQRFLSLTGAKSDAGIALTDTAAAGAMGVSRTAGTSLYLAGETTSDNAKTDKVMWEFDLPDIYIAGTDIPITVNASVAGDGTLTDASTTMTVAAYTETNGVEATLTVSDAQQMVAAGSDLVFTVTGTDLVPGQHLALELVMLVTSASGANTGQVNSVSFQA